MEKSVVDICLSMDEISALNDLLYHHVEFLKSRGQEYKSMIDSLEKDKNYNTVEIFEAAHMLFNSTADSLECYNNLWHKLRKY